ncbi:sensor histidine kinase [Hymenobacter norwichensis]|uniref:sensor histidine kinase n=1 Tax=Hymenobacter norwichensis TaxID=223903 RepID=UPI0003B49222|nr:ATP-binding protein [Hymenobacter norwichensis]
MSAPSEVTFSYLFLLGVAFMILAAGALIVFFVFHRQRLLQQQQQLRATEARHQQQMLTALIEAQETERKRIGQDLHDSIGSTVSTAKLLVSRLRDVPAPPNAHELLPLVEELLVSAVYDVRSISRDLYPILLSRFGLAEALRNLVLVSNESGRMPVTLEVHYPKPSALPQELALYRICQELIANSLRHAQGATQLSVSLQQTNVQLTLLVKDNGCGFTPDVNPGMGLRSIALRVQMLQAQLHQHSALGQGTRTEVTLPLSVDK